MRACVWPWPIAVIVPDLSTLLAQMVRKGQNITAADERRFAQMQQIGCIPCIIEGELRGVNRRGTPGDVNHLLQGQDHGYRLGHKYTVSECPWHHRGVLETPTLYNMGLTGVVQYQKHVRGPSRALHNREFHKRYGSDVELLARQDEEIEKLEDLTV